MRPPLRALPLVVIAVLLTGCSPVVVLKPAENAVDPACAEVIVHLPATVDGLPARETDAQATSAWGTPASVILRCGVPVPPPTAEFPCVTVDGVDWLRDDSDDPRFVFTTYGRDPAVEVIVDATVALGVEALTDLSSAVAGIPADGQCIGVGEPPEGS